MQTKILSFLTIIFFFTSSAQCLSGNPIDLESFTKEAEFDSINLSPDGLHFAATIPLTDQTALAIFHRKTMKSTYVYRFSANQYVEDYYWVDNQRLVFTRSIERKSSEARGSYGQIFAGNIDGSKKKIIFGYQASGSNMSIVVSISC